MTFGCSRASLLSLLLVTGSSTARAAPPGSEWEYQAHLVTIGAGASTVERLGRSLIAVGRVRPGRVENVVYDLGASEEAQGLLDLLSGTRRLRVLRAGTVTRALSPFVAVNRRVEVQRLRLQPREIDRLRTALMAELQPGRQSYASHPLGETSATRARDVIDAATGAAVRGSLGGQPGTARQLLRRELAGSLAGELLLDLFGGRPLDRPLDAHGALFLPRRLRDAVAEARRQGALLAEPASAVHRGHPVAREELRPAERLAWVWAAALAAAGLLALWRLPRSRAAGLFVLLGLLPIGGLGLGLFIVALTGRAAEVRANELLLCFLVTDLALAATGWRWFRGAASAGTLLLGYSIARAALAAAVLGAHAAGLLIQQPRALLAPPLVGAGLLLAVVLRVRTTASGRIVAVGD